MLSHALLRTSVPSHYSLVGSHQFQHFNSTNCCRMAITVESAEIHPISFCWQHKPWDCNVMYVSCFHILSSGSCFFPLISYNYWKVLSFCALPFQGGAVNSIQSSLISSPVLLSVWSYLISSTFHHNLAFHLKLCFGVDVWWLEQEILIHEWSLQALDHWAFRAEILVFCP